MKALYVEDDSLEADRTRRELARHAPHVSLEVVPTLAEARARMADGGDYEMVLVGLNSAGDGEADLLPAIREQGLSVPVIALNGAAGVAAAARLFGSGGAGGSDEATRRLLESVGEDARFRALVENSPYCIHEIDREGRFASMNPAGLRMLGIGGEADIVDTPYLDVVDPADRSRVEALRQRALRGDTTHFEFSSPAGQRFASNFVPLRDDAGRVERLMGITVDISERLRVEEALEHQQELAARLVDIAPVIILLLDPNGAIRHVNPCFEQLSGYRLDEVRGKEWFATFLPERDRDRIRDLFRTTTHDVPTRGNVNPIVTRNGEEREIEWYDQAMRDGQGRVTGLLAIGQDVTERRRADAELRKMRDRLAATLEAIPDLLFEVDEAGRILDYRARQRELLAAPPERFMGRTISEVLPPDAAEVCLDAVAEAAANGVSFGKQYQLTVPGGERWFEASVARKAQDPGERAAFVMLARDITGRKQAEESLRTSEERYRLLAEYAPVGIYVHDGRTILYANREFAEILGAGSPGDVLGRTLESIVHPDDRAAVQARVEALRAGGVVNPLFAGRIVRLDGEARYTEVMATACTFEGRSAIQVVLVDVTERRRAELEIQERDRALRASAMRLNEAQRMAQLGSWELDLVTNGLTWSDEIFRIFEIDATRFDASYEAFLDAVHPDDRDAVDRAYAASVETLAPYEITHRLLMADGRVKYVQERGETFYGSGGEPLRSLGTVQDITDRKLTEDVLRLLSTGVVHLSGAAFFNEIAARTAQLLGAEIGFVCGLLPDAEPRIRTLGLSVDGELQPAREYDPAGTPCEAVVGNEVCVVPDGAQRLFPADRYLADMGVSAYAGLPLLDRDGAPIGHVGVMSRRPFDRPERVEAALRLVAVRAAAEIERVRAEEERAALEAHLRAAQKMEAIGTLAGGIAHDFNNILTAIIGNTELAAMDIGTRHPAAEMIDEIRLASRRAKELVSQILTFSQRQEQPQTAVALRPLVEEVTQLLHAALPPAVEVVTAFGDGDPTVLADPTQMHQVLMNLCTNAWQAMDGEPGRIEIHLDEVTLDAAAARPYAGLRPGRHARLVVSDTGKGMDAATVERIFEPFFTTKSVGQGTGLGLAVAHGIVRARGGAIAVRSQPGAGSVFEVYLPVGAVAEPAAPLGAPALPRGAGQHLLYLDDEPALVRVTTRILKTMGYRVTGFTDAAEALAAFAANPGQFDAVLTDLSMPGASGLDVIRDMSRLRPGMPIALTSGFPTDEVHASARALGCREVIKKPASIEDIANALHRMFSAG